MTGMLIVSIADLLYTIPDNFRAATKIIRIKLLFTRKNSAFDQRDFCDGSKMHPPPVNKQEQARTEMCRMHRTVAAHTTADKFSCQHVIR